MRTGWCLLSLLACGSTEAIPGPTVRMEPGADELYANPFPNEGLLNEAGHVDLRLFPNPKAVAMVRVLKQLIGEDARGFGTTAGLFLALSGPPQENLPEGPTGLDPQDPIFLSSLAGERVPIELRFTADGGPHGAPNLLSVLPVQGFPLRPDADYALVVRRSVVEGVSLAMRQLIASERPEGMSDRSYALHLRAIEALQVQGLDPEDLAGLSAFHTDDPTRGLRAALPQILAEGPAPPTLQGAEVYPDYCVFHAVIEVPDYQSGDPPYDSEGDGRWLGDQGALSLARRAPANLWLTVPRRPMPSAGYPVVVFVRTGGGGDRPLIDRGVHAVAHGSAAPGSGPAEDLAKAGWAGLSIDGPHGGLRNPSHADEQFLIFNIQNPVAMRDNIRQSALELALTAHLVEGLTASSTACPGLVGAARFNPEQLALFGHSMGATIGPLAVAIEPRYSAMVLSGAGGSWIENVIHKRSPVEVKFLAELLLEYEGRSLSEHDPVLSLLQWAGEAADPPVYAEALRDRQVLMFQGIEDSYIPPPIANSLSTALGLDAALPLLEPSIGPRLALASHQALALPVRANDGALTRVLVQQAADGIEDGHEVVFQTEGPKFQYRCFLDSMAAGRASVPAAQDRLAPCPTE